MAFSLKKLFGSLVLKQNQKETQVDFLDKNQNWQTQKQSPELYDQCAISASVSENESSGIQEPSKKETTKIEYVKKHLQENGSIDSWTAIHMYRATRLSGIIYTLKNSHGMNIESIIDNKSKSHFATYILK